MILSKICTYANLGLLNLTRVAAYRAFLRSGFFRFMMPIGKSLEGSLFKEEIPEFPVSKAEEAGLKSHEDVSIRIFGWKKVGTDNLPRWHASSLSGLEHDQADKHWTEISDFLSNVGDIKEIWEISRFRWAVQFARQAVTKQDKGWVIKLNQWVADWNKHNPCHQGPNWKCGQEASFRVMHLCLSALLLNQHRDASKVMLEMIEQHLKRISPTIHYAMAQDNNHGTSEAAALFIGGVFLSKNKGGGQARRWQNKGRYWLENRARRLIENDGSFSQYSVNYHRVMLDTLCLAEIWRRAYQAEPFSTFFYDRARAATKWLRAMTSEESGDAPNLGANDGAWIMPLSDAEYRDFRPTVQLAAALFYAARAYGPRGSYDAAGDLLGVSSQNQMSSPTSVVFNHGGYAVLKNDLATAFLRFPKFRFRPSHCDALHLDLFVKGKNILPDGGSYSYNCDEKWLNYFPGTEAHNTVQFDHRDQMPRLSRFLYGRWLRCTSNQLLQTKEKNSFFSAGYTDGQGACHQRKISLSENKLIIEDKVSGIEENAVLRWRLGFPDWKQKGRIIYNEDVRIEIMAETGIDKIEVCEGWESRYYGQKTKLPVLEVTTSQNSKITTEISWV